MTLNKVTTGGNIITHEFLKALIRISGVFNNYPLEHSGLRIHGCRPELICIHFSKTLVPLDANALISHILHNLPHFFFGICIFFLFSLGYPVQGRLCQVNISCLDKWLKIAEEKGHEQSINVGTVNICIGHNDDMMVPGFLNVKRFPYSGPDCGDESLNFQIFQDFVNSCFLYI